MQENEWLREQIELAVLEHRARYILVATVGGEEYDVGEAMIGPASNVDETLAALTKVIIEKLQRVPLTDEQIAGAEIALIEAPLLY